VTNIVRELSVQLKGKPCKVYANDMRVKVSLIGPYTYPDVLVMCGQAEFDDEQKDTLLNPTIIVEVLSKLTENYDRGDKFAHYRRLDTLKEYILVAQHKHHIEHYRRQPDNKWLFSEAQSLDSEIKLPSIECRLLLREVYDKIE
jgi:Uma2 family endonuclease